MITLTELIEKLSREDEVDLIDALKVTSSDITEAFEDLIETKQEYLIETFGYENDETVDR